MKELAAKCDSLKSSAARNDIDTAVRQRVQLAGQVMEGVQLASHWMMEAHEDPLGRRVLLVPNKGTPCVCVTGLIMDFSASCLTWTSAATQHSRFQRPQICKLRPNDGFWNPGGAVTTTQDGATLEG